jgi:hypothetical protein
MQIVCATTGAAAEVLTLLLAAHLRPIIHFGIRPVFSITPPITYTLYRALTDEQMAQIRAIADTAVVV